MSPLPEYKLLGIKLFFTCYPDQKLSNISEGNFLDLYSCPTAARCILYRVSAFLCPLLLLLLCLALQGKEVSQESVKHFYENWISRQNTLSSLEDQDGCLPPPLTSPTTVTSHFAYAKLKNQASKVSWGSSFSRWSPPGIFMNLQAWQMWKQPLDTRGRCVTVFSPAVFPPRLQLYDRRDDDLL